MKRLKWWLYMRRVLRDGLNREWESFSWREEDGCEALSCRACPKFDARRSKCVVPRGTPLRKCVTAATEANLRSFRGLRVLEIGCGEGSYAKTILEARGNTWVGLDPRSGKKGKKSVRTLYGHAADIPLKDAYFDAVIGIQTIEHFEDPNPDVKGTSTYAACLAEIARVLKPGGRVYFDAPIHLHGHEIFVMGDIERIRSLFDSRVWREVTLQKWRFDHSPLPVYSPPEKETRLWAERVRGYAPEKVDALRRSARVWLLTMQARKVGGNPF